MAELELRCGKCWYIVYSGPHIDDREMEKYPNHRDAKECADAAHRKALTAASKVAKDIASKCSGHGTDHFCTDYGCHSFDYVAGEILNLKRGR